MNNFVVNEINTICDKITDLDKFKNKTFFITGGTGFIGSYIIYVLSKLNKDNNLGIKIIASARNKEKVEAMEFDSSINWIYSGLNDEFKIDNKIDYIIHTASPTDSKYFIDHPVELINDTISGINNTMKLAVKNNVLGYVFTSSLEVYGMCLEDRFLKENEYFSIDCNNVRNSYSEGKKLLECLCSSYAKEYNVNAKIVRLGQTFGPGITKNDNRVFAQFAKAVTSNNDIVLATKGETKRSYCSIIDAVYGIFKVLFYGNSGEAYNLASDNSYYSIYEMAELFINNTNSKIIINEVNDNKYLATIKYGLNTNKIKSIGFKSFESLDEMINKFKKYYSTI